MSWLESVLLMLLGTVAATAFAAPRPSRLEHQASDEETEVAFLLSQGTADSLATASLLAHLIRDPDDGSEAKSAKPQPTALIEKAVALAPGRPELIWLLLRDCEQRRCSEELRIAARLKALDPDNGFAWLAELRTARSFSAPEVTQILEQIGAAKKPRLYWNNLAVMMFDSLTHHGRSQPATAITRGADDRLTYVIGILAAVDIPAFQAMTHACRVDQFDLPGRREACQSVMTRLTTSDTVITQGMGVGMQEGWWSVDSPEHEALRQKHLQLRYLIVASSRARGAHADEDAVRRVDAMRHLQREDEVERAMLTSFHEPLERPADWRSPGSEE